MSSDDRPGAPCCVLLVEDNDDHAELIQRNLQRYCGSDEVKRVPDGEAALDYLYRRGEYADPRDSPRPQVVILDLRLPKIGGLKVLADIKTSPKLYRIPVVVLTSSESERDLVSAYDLKANAYAVKPLDYDKFAELMSSLGTFWTRWNRQVTASTQDVPGVAT